MHFEKEAVAVIAAAFSVYKQRTSSGEGAAHPTDVLAPRSWNAIRMGMRDVEHSWNTIGEVDAMFGVLSDPEKLGGGWDSEQFYETGRAEIAGLFHYLASIDVSHGSERALDFGCGVGRLSSALADRFEIVVAVDIAESMIARARQLVAKKNIRWVLNRRADLSLIESDSVDLLYSNLVLQHMPPAYAMKYISEFVRVIKPESGVGVFQLPDRAPHSLRRTIDSLIIFLDAYLPKALLDAYRMKKFSHVDSAVIKRLPKRLFQMNGASRDAVQKCVEKAGGTIRAVRPAPIQDGWQDFEYVISKDRG